VTRKTQPLRHVEAHLAKSNDSQFHLVFPSLMRPVGRFRSTHQ
jgi:hypothetical protein